MKSILTLTTFKGLRIAPSSFSESATKINCPTIFTDAQNLFTRDRNIAWNNKGYSSIAKIMDLVAKNI